MVGIVILNYNNVSDIRTCIESVAKFTDFSQAKLIVVDNGSKETVVNYVKTMMQSVFSDVRIISEGQKCSDLSQANYVMLNDNRGYARGNNAALEYLYADQDITEVLILNSDIILVSDIVSPLVVKLYEISDVGALSPILYRPTGEIDYCCARKNYSSTDLMLTFSILGAKQYNKRKDGNKILLQNPELINKSIVEIELPSGSCMMFKKNILQKIGGFDSNTFLYYEESILHKKLHSIGCHNYVVPAIGCIHTGGATTTSTKNAYFLKRCNFDSVMYYCKHYENMKPYQLIYIYISAHIILARLWLGRLARKVLKK